MRSYYNSDNLLSILKAKKETHFSVENYILESALCILLPNVKTVVGLCFGLTIRAEFKFGKHSVCTLLHLSLQYSKIFYGNSIWSLPQHITWNTVTLI